MARTAKATHSMNLSDGLAIYDPATGEPIELQGTSGAAHVVNTAVEPGDAQGLPYDHKAAMPVCTSTYIATATTTTCVTGAGVLHTITITEDAAGAITVYDNTAGSGTIIAAFEASAPHGSYIFDCKFTTGLTIVTAAATKLTVTHAAAA